MNLQELSLEELNEANRNTLMESLGIEYTSVSSEKVTGRMPVDHRTCQPGGLLHGGAHLALAETLAGLGSALIVDINDFSVSGIQVSGNHVRSIDNGVVYGTARIIHEGNRTHVWNIDITNESGELVSICRVTNMITRKNG